jgi:hypothetical protein
VNVQLDLYLNHLDELRGMALAVRSAREMLLPVVRRDPRAPLSALSRVADAVDACDKALVSIAARTAQIRMRVAELGGTVPFDMEA